MALEDLKAYYKECEKAHLKRRDMLEQAANVAAETGMYQEKLDQLTKLYQESDSRYQFFAHIMWLLSLPKRDSKKAKMLTRDEKLMTTFSKYGFDEKSIQLENEDVLVKFRDFINNLKEEQ